MARTAVLGLPRVGPDRELKFALEIVLGRAHRRRRSWPRPRASLRAGELERARAAGIDVDPVGRLQPLRPRPRHRLGVGAIPSRFGASAAGRGLDTCSRWPAAPPTCAPLEMTKWFDTNYHYLVPELAPEQALRAGRVALVAPAAGGRGAGHRHPPRGPRPATASSCSPRAWIARSTCCRG